LSGVNVPRAACAGIEANPAQALKADRTGRTATRQN
jgi:hypothetical protein